MMIYSFFFFKQKTAYEMRISDWSSDVCSSDLYSFRLLYLTFFGQERFRDVPHDDHAHDAHDDHAHHGAHEPHESPWVVTLPLVLLAIPSVVIGFITTGPMLFGTDMVGHVQIGRAHV